MSDMKCPICNKNMVFIENPDGFDVFVCTNSKCNCLGYAGKSVWEYIDRTKKQLEIAVDALKKIDMRCQNTVRNYLQHATIRGELCDISFYARKAVDDIDNLEQITALEQKD